MVICIFPFSPLNIEQTHCFLAFLLNLLSLTLHTRILQLWPIRTLLHPFQKTNGLNLIYWHIIAERHFLSKICYWSAVWRRFGAIKTIAMVWTKLNVAPRVENTEVFKKGWNFLLLWTKETAFFSLFLLWNYFLQRWTIWLRSQLLNFIWLSLYF